MEVDNFTTFKLHVGIWFIAIINKYFILLADLRLGEKIEVTGERN